MIMMHDWSKPYIKCVGVVNLYCRFIGSIFSVYSHDAWNEERERNVKCFSIA